MMATGGGENPPPVVVSERSMKKKSDSKLDEATLEELLADASKKHSYYKSRVRRFDEEEDSLEAKKWEHVVKWLKERMK